MKRTKLIESGSSEGRTGHSAPRRVDGLVSCSLAQSSPWPKVRLKGARAKGKAYERKVGKLFRKLMGEQTLQGELFEGQWLAFYDANGRGYAQPDYYILAPAVVLLVEVKLKQNTDAHLQLDQLYRPLLERLYALPVVMLQVFKFPRWEADARRIPSLQ